MMLPNRFFENPAFRKYIKLLYKLHVLIRENRDETAEGDSIRDQMDDPWENLSSEEVKCVNAISADLHLLSNPDRSPSTSLPPREEVVRELRNLETLIRSGQIHLAFDLLGTLEPYLQPARSALERYRIWSAVGEYEIAIDFLRASFERDFRTALDEMTVGERREARERSLGILDDASKPPLELSGAAIAPLLSLCGDLSEPESRSTAQSILPSLEREIGRREKEPNADQNHLARLYGIRVLLLKTLDRLDEANEVLRSALSRFPDDPSLLAIRGMLIFDRDPNEAYRDFDRVVASGEYPPDVCLLLAYRAVESGDDRNCLRFCFRYLESMKALARRPADEAMALMMEWCAISAHGLGWSDPIVEDFLDEAGRLAPGNVKIKENQENFSKHLKFQSSFDWQKEDSKTVLQIARENFRPAA